MLRRMGALLTVLVLGFPVAFGQTCQISPSEADKVFELTDTFGDDAVLRPFDDEGAFPWWALRPAGPVAVIESVEVTTAPEGYSALLDAQYLDGNDLIVSVPVGIRLAQTWGCGDENAVATLRR